MITLVRVLIVFLAMGFGGYGSETVEVELIDSSVKVYEDLTEIEDVDKANIVREVYKVEKKEIEDNEVVTYYSYYNEDTDKLEGLYSRPKSIDYDYIVSYSIEDVVLIEYYTNDFEESLTIDLLK